MGAIQKRREKCDSNELGWNSILCATKVLYNIARSCL